MVPKRVRVGGFEIGGGRLLALIAGPCVIEGRDSALRHASFLKQVADRIGVPFIYKSSYDKANRSEEHTSELQSLTNLVCRLLLEKKKKQNNQIQNK